MQLQIIHLKRQEINNAKWNACVDAAANGLLYSYTDYLDAFAGNWDALVLDDYKAVLPLPWRKKWNFYYVYHPFLTPQTGITGNHLTAEIVIAFLQAIPKKFSYADLQLNFGNNFTFSHITLKQRCNFVLNLDAPYETLFNNYRKQVKRNIQKGIKAGCTVVKNIPAAAVVQLAKQYTPGILRHQKELALVQQLYALLEEKNAALTYGVYDQNKRLLASAIYFFSHKRAYYILVGNHPAGKKLGASHLLIDAFIKDHCNTAFVLDFEGSDVLGLQFFYSSFGAKNEPYPVFKINRLPFFIRWFKS